MTTRNPVTEFVYEAIAEIGDIEVIGKSPLGERRIVPILGGTFEGPLLKGDVLAGGADRQIQRTDGVLELDALYEMRTDDGVLLTIRNRVIIDTLNPYARSHVVLSAPTGRYDWLNRRIFVGTLEPLMPNRKAVCVRVFEVC
jgi:Protein of unknown function (DUF3237)